ncbi:MAG: group II intron reverse transcriptase/maturase [Dysgonamonadaceae bacterium]|jgi:group II intron reverse transcriptase/maturase|nr:group II intron reverse transcriptase/maturase [Dysgonamonadaceae bacterium]
MRSPERVLNNLSEHSKVPNYKFERLYRILFNEEMYYVAYQNIYASEGNMTEGFDGQTIDSMSLPRIGKLISSLKNETYQPQPSKRVYIPKKNGKMRPLGVPAFDDKLLQEVVRMVLEAIYERSFKYTSHGFRPKRSCHTALAQVQKTFNGAKWFIEGDIKGFFDNINHDIMIKTLEERITDNRFIRLIRKFLNAGYIEEWTFHNTYSGTPQGGIVSPILANIYLDRLDKYMEEYIQKFDKGVKRKPGEECKEFANARKRIVRKLKKVKDEVEKEKLVQELKANEKERALFSNGDEMDTDYKRLKYVRYADDFLIGVIGSKDDAKTIKEDVKRFLDEKLALELSDEKTLITHTEKSAKFLGYEIYIRKTNLQRRDKRGRLRRSYNKRLYLKVSYDTIRNKLLDYGVLEFKYRNGKEVWKPKCRSRMIFNDDLEILDRYNGEIRGFYNYYSIANKYKSSTRKINKKYRRNKVFAVKFTVKSGVQKERHFYNAGFKRKNPMNKPDIDIKHSSVFVSSSTSLIDRLKAEKCELCGATEGLIMHHVRRLKDLKGKEGWEKHMIARHRKTVAVCGTCHRYIHLGKID